VWCVLAGIERFIVEFFRAKDDRFSFLGGLSTAQVIAIAIALIGVAIMYARARVGPGRSGIRAVEVATA
jgi:phosphatidylglycerol:prolipoprotein diacylglycerol transferase